MEAMSRVLGNYKNEYVFKCQIKENETEAEDNNPNNKDMTQLYVPYWQW